MKILSLILYSDDIPQYKQLMTLSQRYNEKISQQYDYKYFYLQMKEDLSTDILEDGHFLYVKGKECLIPGMYDKLVSAIRYLDTRYEYDHLLRTNISSFWNMYNFFELVQRLPSSGAAGIVVFNQFISGTGVIMSKDVANTLATYPNQNSLDDVLITGHLVKFTQISQVDDSQMPYLCDGYTENIPNHSNVLYYRIKNANRDDDVKLFKRLLKIVYDIQVD